MGSKTLVRPRAIAPGSRVALVTPAGPLSDLDDLARGIELCRALGWEPVPGEHVLARHGYLAGTDAERLVDLNPELTGKHFADPVVVIAPQEMHRNATRGRGINAIRNRC